jgi:C-terminal of Roc, COR, domain
VRAGKASVIIVGTHLDDPRCTTEHVSQMLAAVGRLEQRYEEMIRGAVAVSTTVGDGVPSFEKLLVRVAKAQSFYGEKIPAAYEVVCETMNCRRALIASPVLSFAEFSAVAMDCKVAQESDVLHVANFLHQLGEITYFAEGALRDIVVLDPQWLTKVFSTVVTMKANYVREDGVLRHSYLAQLWRAPLYPRSVHHDLLSLFHTYELIYQLKPGLLDGESLVPCLLSERPPSAERLRSAWPPLPPHEVPHGRVYRFAFFPDAFFSRLMVRVLNSKEWRLLIHWKYGLVISRLVLVFVCVGVGVGVDVGVCMCVFLCMCGCRHVCICVCS